MTDGELLTFAAIYLGGIVAGALIGKARGSWQTGLIAAMLLGPLFGIIVACMVKPPTSRGPAVQPQKQPW